MVTKSVFIFASISGLLAVGLGAFGAHALKPKLEVNGLLDAYHTAIQYQFYHTLTLLLIGVLMDKFSTPFLIYSSYAMMIGILLFSGSLYLMCLTNIKWLGAITPIGGVGFIAGWFFLLIASIKNFS